MLVSDFEIIITKPFPASLMLSPFRFYGDMLKLVETIAHRVWRLKIKYKLFMSIGN